MKSVHWGLSALTALAAGSVYASPDQTFPLRVIAVNGQSLPGTTGTYYPGPPIGGTPNIPTITSGGLLLLPHNELGLWTMDLPGNGPLSLYALNGTPMSGGAAGATWTVPERSVLDELGRLTGSYFQRNQVTIGQPGTFVQVAASGRSAPGFPGRTFGNGSFGRPVLSPNGLLAFRAYAGTSDYEGVWVHTLGGTTTLVFGAGQQAPGLPEGITVYALTGSGGVMPSVSRSGLMTIEGFLTRTGTVTEANDMVLWVGPPGALVPVVREGDMIDLMPCFGAGSAVLNDSGQLAALSALGTANTAAVLRIENSNKVLVALARQRGPGMGANDLWQGQSQSTFSAPLINAQGDVLFSGSIWNPGAFPVYQSGLWIYDGEVSLVTRSGYSINGLPQAVSQILGDFSVNAAGDVVFRASLDPIVQTAGLFHWTSETGVSPIVMVGSVIELAPGVTKIVSGIQWASGSGGQDGRPTGLSDNGFLSFLVFFTDSTGAVIVTNVQSGACCHPSGTCVASIRSNCAAGSIWTQGGLCTPSSCVPAVGACCAGTLCSVGDFAACSGAFQGPGTTCGDALNPTTCCPANFNGTGGVGVQDIFDFLAAYFSGNPAADFNSTGGLTVQDIFELLAAFFAGCD